jgi:hypothetical protein
MIDETPSPETLHKQAIDAAISCNWQNAISGFYMGMPEM